MTTTTAKKKTGGQMFDQDDGEFYPIDRPLMRRNMFEVDAHPINEKERFMLDAFHTQSVAVAGRSAISQYGTTEIGNMAAHAAGVMKGTMEQVHRLESTALVGRLSPRFQYFNDQLLTDFGRSVLEINTLGIRSMYDDTRGPIHEPPAPPPRRKRKGVLRGLTEYLFGEEFGKE